jgi:hypothetical protein
MSQPISAKIAALQWIPNGEVDDTRFEKLFDDLSSYTATQNGTETLLKEGLLSTLKVCLFAFQHNFHYLQLLF